MYGPGLSALLAGCDEASQLSESLNPWLLISLQSRDTVSARTHTGSVAETFGRRGRLLVDSRGRHPPPPGRPRAKQVPR